MVAVAAMSAGYSSTYDAQNESELTGVALANVEALANNTEGYSNERPRYINKTETKDRVSTKTEINKDGIKIEFKRECTDVITYCKHTGEKEDICYVDLNGTKTTCGQWEENQD